MITLSIIIPAFNENKKIRQDILAASEFLTHHGITGEIIVVDDGSKDETAQKASETIIPNNIEKKIIHYTPNHGKGYAVKKGIGASTGDYVMFADSGVCIEYNFALKGLKLIQENQCEIAHGSRKLRSSVIKIKQSPLRRLTSQIFRFFIFSFMGIPQHLTDTQCGFKIYKGTVAREIYKETQTNGFTFDIEVILRAVKKGFRIMEFPVIWFCDRDTRVFPILILGKVVKEFIRIRKTCSNLPSHESNYS
jgi:dolichyl-phosphate beta-glucosyltransferase